MLKLTEVKDPQLQLSLVDGTLKAYDLFTVIKEMEAQTQALVLESRTDGLDVTIAEQHDAIRQTLGFPTEKDAAESAEPKPFTLTASMCFAVTKEIERQLEDLQKAKKPSPPRQT